MLQEHDGALSFTMDAWTSPNHKALVAVTVHFENDGVSMCMILNLVEVVMSHLGVNLAAAFAHILEEFGISEKVSTHAQILDKKLTYYFQLLGITCNNVSSNDTMIDEIPNIIEIFPGDENQVQCFNHVNALVTKSTI